VPAGLTTRIAQDPGDPLLNTWILWWNTQAVPFTEKWWNPPIFFPARGALAYSEHLFGIAVFTTPLQLVGLNPIGAYNVALILSSWLSATFAFLLARRLTGSLMAGIIAGIAFGFAPYRIGHLSHLQVLTAQWMALALFAMHSYLDDRRRRWLLLFAVAWLLQALSNGYYLLFFPVLIGAWIVWFVRWRTDPAPGIALAATLALSSLLLLPSLLKYREVHAAAGLGRQRGEMVLFSATPGSFLRMVDPWRFWPFVEPRTQEDFLFPGMTCVLLVVVAAVVARRRTRLRAAVARRSPLMFYALVTLFMWWLALGPAPEEHPLLGLVKPYTALAFLPGFNGLRAPSRFAMLGCLTLSVAAALAYVRLKARTARWKSGVAALILAGLFVDASMGAVPLIAPPARVAMPEMRGVAVLELPADEPTVATGAMFRQISHRLPLISGYSGHSPPHYRILAKTIARDDPTAILYLARAQPLIIVIDGRRDPSRATERLVRSLPGIQQRSSTSTGVVFLLPSQPRPPDPAPGRRIQPVSTSTQAREHVVYDLGASRIVRTIAFPLRGHFEDFHPRFEVESSSDGVTWTRAWYGWTGGLAIAGALENQREAPVRIQLPDVEARYLRIHPAQSWMTDELQIIGMK
jgi:hypothetical protein